MNPAAHVSETVQPDNWSTSDQHLLLSACLLPDARAVAAWERWLTRVDIDRLDYSSFRLLPLLYRNLVDQGVDHPELGRLKGVYRRTWWMNQVAFNEVMPVVAALTAAGLQPILLKGAAYLVGADIDFGARPMADVDVLVARSALDQAQAILVEHGWTPQHANVAPSLVFHAIAFSKQVNTLKLEIDLHWHLMPEAGAELTAEYLLPTCRRVDYQGRSYLLLPPTVQLFVALVHGTRMGRGSHLHWIADAVALLRRQPTDIDWGLLQAWAARWWLQRRLHRALCTVALYAPVPPPASVLHALATARLDWRERLELAMVVGRPVTPLRRLVGRLLWYARRRDVPQSPLGYLRHVQALWGVPRLRGLPRAAWRRLVQWMLGRRRPDV